MNVPIPHHEMIHGKSVPKPACAIWLTGLPASGKTTIARHLNTRLEQSGTEFEFLDSDELRLILTPNAQYDQRERDFFYRAVACLAKYLTDHYVNVVIAATANKRQYRDHARSLIKHFFEVHVCCPLAICEARDPKGLYRRAREGNTDNVPGVQSVYELGYEPELVIYSDKTMPQEAADLIFRELSVRGWINTSEAYQ